MPLGARTASADDRSVVGAETNAQPFSNQSRARLEPRTRTAPAIHDQQHRPPGAKRSSDQIVEQRGPDENPLAQPANPLFHVTQSLRAPCLLFGLRADSRRSRLRTSHHRSLRRRSRPRRDHDKNLVEPAFSDPTRTGRTSVTQTAAPRAPRECPPSWPHATPGYSA